ncbi:MAG TPA: LamG-like jellyroll fold domain-containing protein [Chthoniobacterales bacterium]
MKQSNRSLACCAKLVYLSRSKVFAIVTAIGLFLHNPLCAQVFTVEDVIWEDLVGTTANYDSPGSGSILQKTAVGNKADADAVSQKRIEGDGFVEFRFGQTNKSCAVGLGYFNRDRRPGSIHFALQGDQFQKLHVLSNGSDSIVGNYQTSDIFRIERTGAMIRFWKNGSTLLATSTRASAGALVVDTSFSHTGAFIQGCRYSRSVGIDDVIWKDLISTAASYADPGGGSTLTSTADSNFNADAVSSGEIPADGFVQFRFGKTNTAIAVGLALANKNRSNLSLDHAFEGGADGRLYIRESGVSRIDPNNPNPSTNSWFGSYTTNDIFRIERLRTTIRYYRNDVLLYTSPFASTGALIVDTSFKQRNAYVANVQYGGASTAESIVWQDFYGTSATTLNGENQLSKKTATDAWDSDAIAHKSIPGNGYVQWRFGVSGKQMAVGLTRANTDHTLNGLEYAICTNGTSSIQIYENGIPKGSASAWNISDTLRIQRLGSTIVYLKNDQKIGMTNLSPSAATESLLVDTAFRTSGGVVASARFDGVKSDVVWRDLTNTSATFPTPGSGSSLTKSTGDASWNAGGVGEAQITGNGFVEFKMGLTNKSGGLGLGATDSGNTPFQIAVGFFGQYTGSNIQLYITEYGTARYSVGIYATSDVLKIERVGDQFYFYRNGFLLPYASAVRSTDPLWIDTSFYDKHASVNSVEYYAPSPLEDIIWIDETNAEGTYPTPNQGSRLQPSNIPPSAACGANSSKVMAGDGFVQWRLEQANADVTVGLSKNRTGFSLTDLTHAIRYRASDGVLEVREGGNIAYEHATSPAHPFSPSDTLKIVRTAGAIRYLLNGVEIYASASTVAGPVVVKGCFNGISGDINHAQYYQFDGDRDGLDDAWEYYYFGDLQQQGTDDFDGDSHENILEHQTQSDPADYYNGVTPEISITEGNNQIGPQERALPLALKVRVLHEGISLSNAPVTFGPIQGGGQVLDLSGTSIGELLTVRTDSEGVAQVWFKTPGNAPATSTIVATAGAATSVLFTEFTLLAAPTGVSAVPGDRSVTLSWSGITEASSYKVLRRVNGGDFQDFEGNETVATSLTDTGLTNGTKYYYVVQALNAGGISGYSNEVSTVPVLDVDGDSLPDDWEMSFFGTLDQLPEGDFDSDAVTNSDEFWNHLNPAAKDTDSDGREDGVAMDGFIKWEQWSNVPGAFLTALNAIQSFPYRPDNARYVHSLEMPIYQGANYGARMAGYVKPAVSGNYRFWVSGDDQVAFGISSNADPGRLTYLIETSAPTEPLAFDTFPEQNSNVVPLEAGELYYFEVVSKQEYGFDHAEVAWQLEGGAREVVPVDCLSSLRRVPVGNYRFDEVDGSTAYNSSPALVHATIIGSATRGAGWISRGLTLDGSSGYLEALTSSVFDITGEITLAAWVSPISTGNPGAYMRVISKRAFGNAGGYELEYNPAIKRLTFCGQAGEQLIAQNVDLTKGYHHVAATLARTTDPQQFLPRLYVDGNLVEAQIYVNRGRVLKDPQVFSPLSSNAYPLTIGRHAVQIPNDPGTVAAPQYFKGAIDDVRIYDRAWPQAEIAEYIHSYTRGVTDRDHDGLNDQWEIEHFGSLNYSGLDDPDGDHLTNIYEFTHGLQPNDPDSNDDGIPDGWINPVVTNSITVLAGVKDGGDIEDDSWLLRYNGEGLVFNRMSGGTPEFAEAPVVLQRGATATFKLRAIAGVGKREYAVQFRPSEGAALLDWTSFAGNSPLQGEFEENHLDEAGDLIWQFTVNGHVDSDLDGLDDPTEASLGTSPDKRDTDGDTLSDWAEVTVLRSNPLSQDSDGDGMDDLWEFQYGFDLNDRGDADDDPDGEGLLNLGEYQMGTSPFNPDTDADVLNDLYEANEGLNPISSDDAAEFSTHRNGLINVEQARDSGSNDDGDRLTNLAESRLGTSLTSIDSDQDTVNDGEEAGTGIFPTSPDANGDRDGEGLKNRAEVLLGTRINDFDSDDDGLSDEWERLYGTDPRSLLNGILGWWRFDDGSSRYVYDAAQGMNDGLLRGSVAEENAAVRFSGIRFDPQPAFQPEPRYFRVRAWPGLVATNGLSISFNVKVADNPQEIVTADLVQKLGVYYVSLRPDRKLVFGIKVNGNWRTLVSSSPLAIDRWVHVAATFNPATGDSRIFLDGDPSNSEAFPAGNLDDVPAILQVGAVRSNPSRSAAFSIDDLRLYGLPLTESEVSLLANPSSPTWEANQDWDADGLNNLEEYLSGSDPRAVDSDGDHLSDLDEVSVHHTSPRLKDADGDDLDDDREIHFGTNPTNADTDNDGLWDGEEVDVFGTDPKEPDTDGDGLPDGWEVEHGFDPNDDSDALANADDDLYTNLEEYENGTNPNFDERTDLDLDTDGDGLSDYLETIYYGTDPNNAHTYDPNLNDFDWVMRGTPPTAMTQRLYRLDLNAPGGSVDRVVRALGPSPIAKKPERDADGGSCTANEFGFGSNTVEVKYESGAEAWLASWESGSKVLVQDQVELSGTSPEGEQIKETYSATGAPLPGVRVSTHIGQLPETVFAPAPPISIGGFLNRLERTEEGLVTVTVRRIYKEIVTNCGDDSGGGNGGGGGGSGTGGGGGWGGWGGWGWGSGSLRVYNRPGSPPPESDDDDPPPKPGENDPATYYSSSLAIYTCARPTLKVHRIGTRSAPGTEIKRPEDVETPYFAVLNPNVDMEEEREEVDSADDQIGPNDNDVMKVEIELPKEVRFEGTVTITLPSDVQAHDESGQILESEDLIVDLKDSSARLHDLSKGQATIYVEATESFTGGQLTVSTSGCADSVELFPAEIIPNFDRNESIDLTGTKDRGKVTERTPWRWWINDDEDDGDIARGDSDVPGALSGNVGPFGRGRNYSDPVVNGRCDLVDFFPLFLDLKPLLKALPPGSSTQYKLKHEDNGFGFVYTDLTPQQADDFCVDDAVAGYGPNFSQPAKDATITKVNSAGVVLDPSFLGKISDGGKGILLFEASKETDKPLVLEVTKNGEKLIELKFFIRVRGVEKMYRWVNLRGVQGVGGNVWRATSLSEPENYPDELTNGKNFVFLHGYSVREQQVRGWNAEIFKRLHQLGSKAKYVAVAWRGDEGKLSDWIPIAGGSTLDYYENVINAFLTAPHLATMVNGLSGEKYVAAHSLGNMVASSAIKDHSMSTNKYLMIDAAVALEAYDASLENDEFMRSHMRNPAWHAYSTRLWSTEWYRLFESTDGRNTLTWRGRFGGIANAINFYSSTEDVLQNNQNGQMPSIDSNQGTLAWSKQEMEKGSALIALATWDSYGGWGFNMGWDVNGYDKRTGTPTKTRRTPTQADELTDTQLRVASFFKRFSESRLYDDIQGSAVASDHFIRSQLLAEGLPALSFATGANALDLFQDRNVDMMTLKTRWPQQRLAQQDESWRHSDFREVAFYFTQKVYERFISEADLRQ